MKLLDRRHIIEGIKTTNLTKYRIQGTEDSRKGIYLGLFVLKLCQGM